MALDGEDGEQRAVVRGPWSVVRGPLLKERSYYEN